MKTNNSFTVIHDAEGYSYTYEVMTFEQYKSSRTDQPFCLSVGGRLFFDPIITYINKYGDIEFMKDKMTVYVLTQGR